MPRMELTDDEVELIKERRRKNESALAWNGALQSSYSELYAQMRDLEVPDDIRRRILERMKMFVEKNQKEIK